jgi:predicted HAD superfamily Cof-like phosphohydrolase
LCCNPWARIVPQRIYNLSPRASAISTKSFKIGYSETQEADLDESIVDLRYRLMQEENNEYLEAAKKKDLVEIADALGDKLYILCGTILAHGLQHKIVEVFNEIQRSNMSKLSLDGKPVIREDGKILKGPNYFKPNIKEILDS